MNISVSGKLIQNAFFIPIFDAIFIAKYDVGIRKKYIVAMYQHTFIKEKPCCNMYIGMNIAIRDIAKPLIECIMYMSFMFF